MQSAFLYPFLLLPPSLCPIKTNPNTLYILNPIHFQIQLRIILDAKRWDLLTDFSNYAGLWMSAKVFKRKLLKAGGDVYISPKTCRIRGQLGVELLVGASEHAKEIANAIGKE